MQPSKDRIKSTMSFIIEHLPPIDRGLLPDGCILQERPELTALAYSGRDQSRLPKVHVNADIPATACTCMDACMDPCPCRAQSDLGRKLTHP